MGTVVNNGVFMTAIILVGAGLIIFCLGGFVGSELERRKK